MQDFFIKDYFTSNDVAQIIGTSRVSIRNWILKGRLKASKTFGGHFRIHRFELERFLAANDYELDLIRKYENLKQKNNFLFCWEYYKLKTKEQNKQGLTSCQDCLVYIVQAKNCSLLCRSLKHVTGKLELEAKRKCQECEYFHNYLC